MRPSFSAALTLALALAAGGKAVARDTLSSQGGGRPALPAPAPLTRESFAERRAVRGVALEGAETSETPELRAMRRFEEEAFPRQGASSRPARARRQRQGFAAWPRGTLGWHRRYPARAAQPRAWPPRRPRPSPAWSGCASWPLPELPVRWEPQVIRFLEFFKDDPKGRAIMSVWLRKMGRYRAIIERKLDEQGLPRDLIYLAMIESGFDPGATSLKSAGGVWQFIPGAARAYGLEVSHWVDARRDPERAAEAAARLLKDLYVRFGSWPLAFAAYNAGYGAILRSIARFNTNDFWELARHEAGLPWETSLYVPKILAAAIVGHNLKAFGFANIAQDAPWEFDRVEVSSGISFAALARAAGAKPDVIEDLNPEYTSGRIPPDRPTVVLRVPLGSANLFAKAASDARTGEKLAARGLALRRDPRRCGQGARKLGARAQTHQRRDRHRGIARRHDHSGSHARGAQHARRVRDSIADDTILVAVPDRVFGTQGRERVFYRTRDGDTLADIAAVFDVTADNIVEWNNIDPDAKLQPKLILQLFVREGLDRAGVMLLDPDKVRVVTLGSEEFLELEAARRGKTRLFYAARSGDTLAKIAKRYGLTPGDLARVNRLSATSELSEGQKVVVYSPTPELPKEITAKVTGAPPTKKQALAMKDVAPRNGKSDGKAATIKNTSKTSAAKTSAKDNGKSGKAQPAPGKKPGTGKR
jgi:membrane-bound lytic murein transglycosylase D